MPDSTLPATTEVAGELADALTGLLSKIVDKVLGAPTHDQSGRPLTQVAYMHMPLGDPIDPRDFSDAWTPAGMASISDIQDDGTLGVPADAASADGKPADPTAMTPAQKQLAHSMDSARKTAEYVDRLLHVTNDGSYRPYAGTQRVTSAYEAVITKAQGIPAPKPPADIQARIDEATALLYVLDDKGEIKGKTAKYKMYQKNRDAYMQAQADFANAFAAAMGNPVLGGTWPVTSKSMQSAVDNAYDDWRSAGADEVENALDTLKSEGGSIGEHFLAQARSLYSAWGLGLSGTVSVPTAYSEVLPSSWYDPTDDQNGFVKLSASASDYQAHSASQASNFASSWFKTHSSSTSGGGGGCIFGVTFGAKAGHTESDGQSHGDASGSQSYSFSSQMSNVSIKLEYGLCTIYRPWLLTELFAIDGWYLPGQKDKVVSDGTRAGQNGDDDHHLLPMVPTQFLVLRNVKITASNWGQAGDEMSTYCRQNDAESQSSSTDVAGGVGFLCFGATASHSNTDTSGSQSSSDGSTRNWNFHGSSQFGTLEIDGCQVVGWIGQIMPAAPLVDGTTQSAPASAPAGQPVAAGVGGNG